MIMSMILCRLLVSAQVQEIEQLKLDIEKLAQLKIMLSQMKQGYQNLQNGYNAVRDVAKGNFNLHKNYLDELLLVSDGVIHSPLIAQAESNRSSIVRESAQALGDLQKSGVLKSQEMTDFKNQLNASLHKINSDKNLSSLVLSNGQFRMSDAERTELLSLVYSHSETELAAVRQLIKDYQKLVALRSQEKKDLQSVKRLSGIK